MATLATESATREWLTPAQAARLLGVTPQRVRQLADAGSLTCTRTPLGRLLDPDSVAAALAERTPTAPPPPEAAP